MSQAEYRIESSRPSAGLRTAIPARHYVFNDRALAVAVAAKMVVVPRGQEIRVVHLPTGEVMFRKIATRHPAGDAS